MSSPRITPSFSQNDVPLRWLLPNTVWTILGAALPTTVALFSVPRLVASLGVERFGLLTLMWNLIGYFGVFDLGMGRALTKLVAESPKNNDHTRRAVQHGLIAITALGIAGGAVSAILSPWCASIIASSRPELQPEFVSAFYLMSISVPAVIASAGLRGVVEGLGLFKWSNVIRIFAGIYTFSSPFLLTPRLRTLTLITAVLVVGRILTALAYGLLCLKVMPGLHQFFKWEFLVLKPLMKFGSWLTVSNLLAPVSSTAEKMIIASAASVAALSYFNTPAEIVTKIGILPVAISTVLFPRLSEACRSHSAQGAAIFWQGTRYIFMLLFPVALLTVVGSHAGLSLWLGIQFADNAATTAALMTISVFFNSFIQLSVATLQARGRPEIVGGYQLIELPIYIGLMMLLTYRFGIVGAALAGTIRYAVDMCFYVFSSYRLLDAQRHERTTTATLLMLGTLALCIPLFIARPLFQITYAICTLTVFTVSSWQWLLNANEHRAIRGASRLITNVARSFAP